MIEEKLDIILAAGGFDYNDSVSGSYIMYKIFKTIPDLKFKVLPFFNHTIQKIDVEDFIRVDSLENLPSHKILFATGDDLTEDQIKYICEKYNSKYMVMSMTHWMYSENKNSYPELYENDFIGEKVRNRLSLYESIGAEIVVGSSHSKNVHQKSLMRNLPCHIIPLPFDEIDIEEILQEKTKEKVILWGTTQPETPRKGKKEFEEILNILYTKCKNPEEIKIICVGPKTEINTKFKIEFLGTIRNRKDLSLIYQNCSVFALTTLSDAGPMMCTECLKNRTPVVSYPFSIANDLVSEGKNGYIVNNNEEFADKLYDVLYNQNYHMDLDYIKEFNSEIKVIEKYRNLFKKIF